MSDRFLHIQVGCLVCVTTHAGAVEHEELGEVTSIERPSMEDDGSAYCLFSGPSGNSYRTVALADLRLAELQKWGQVHVTGTESFDVVGEVKGATTECFQVEVQGKLMSKKPSELLKCPPREQHIIGEVQKGAESGKVSVQFPGGHGGIWRFVLSALRPLRVQKGTAVQLTHPETSHIAKGDVGQVTGNFSEHKVQVKFSAGPWYFTPEELEPAKESSGKATKSDSAQKGGQATEPKDFNAATDAKIKKLKSVFKKFDANGDGKLSATELRDVLEAVAKGDLSQQECQQLMQGLDRDQNGKVSVSEFIDYLTMSLVQTVP